jgi:hypothetical protein
VRDMTDHHAASSVIAKPNPWVGALWIVTFIVGLVGLALTGGNADPTAFDYSPLGAVVGQSLIIVAGMLLTGMLVTGAICWQLRHR